MEFDRLVVSFFVDEVVGGFFISVPPGHIACIYDRGRGVLPKVWGPGLHLKIPFWQVAKLFNAQVLEYTITENFDLSKNKEALGDTAIRISAKDNQDILIEGSILFRIDRHNAPELWENLGENVVSKVVRPFSRSRISHIFGEYSLDEIKVQREEIEKRIKADLSHHFENRGLMCEGFLLSLVKAFNPNEGKVETIIEQPVPENFSQFNQYPQNMNAMPMATGNQHPHASSPSTTTVAKKETEIFTSQD